MLPVCRHNDIEALLLEHAAIDDCAVIDRPALDGARCVVAYVVPTGPFSASNLSAALHSISPASPRPDVFVPVSALPYLPDGAVDIERLTALEVADTDLLDRWRGCLSAACGENQATALIHEAAFPAVPLHLWDLLPDGDRRRALPAAPQAAPPTCAVASPQRPAIVDGGALNLPADAPDVLSDALIQAARTDVRRRLVYIGLDGSEIAQSYAELLEEAQRICAGLRQRGLVPGDRVILQLPRHKQFVEAFWACLLGGFIPVPAAVAPGLDRPSAALNALAHAVTVLGQPVILTERALHSSYVAAAARHQLAATRLYAVEDLRLEPDHQLHPAGADDVALMMLTSGSTGVPKAVMLTHRAVLARTFASQQVNGFSSDDVTLNWMPLDHVAGLIYFHLRDVVLGGVQIHVPTELILSDVLSWLDYLARYRATTTFAPNFAFALVNARAAELPSRAGDLSSMRWLLNGAEAIVASTARTFLSLLSPHGLRPDAMRPAWGMSETSSGVTYSDTFSLQTTSDDDRFVDVGRPIPGVRLRVVDENNQVVDEGVTGRLQIRGTTMMAGYFGDDEATRTAVAADGWFSTGDLATIGGGRLTITGREKDVIIVNGVNYYSHAIEAVVDAIPGVEPSFTAACGVRLAGADTDRLAVFFHSRRSDAPSMRDLLSRIRSDITAKSGIAPDFLLPIDPIDIPKTSLGKIQRAELARRFVAGAFDDTVKDVDRLSANANTIPDWFFRKVWRRAEIVPRSRGAAHGTVVLLFADDAGLGARIAGLLRRSGSRCITVRRGQTFAAMTSDACVMNPQSSGDYERLRLWLANADVSLSDVVHCWGFGSHDGAVPSTAAPEGFSVAALAKADLSAGALANVDQTDGAVSALWLTQQLAALSREGHHVRMTFVGSHMQRVGDLDTVACEKTPVLGVLKSAGQELPWLHCGSIDVEEEDIDEAARQVVSELGGAAVAREVAYRNGCRFLPRLEKIAFAPDRRSTPPFERGGFYLITGGSGGIGQLLAQFLRDRFDAQVLLVGRGLAALPGQVPTANDPAGRGVRTHVAYEQADVCDGERLALVVADYEARWSCRLSGVMHLAGAYRECPVTEERADALLETMRAKTIGTAVVHDLLKARGGGLLVCASSVAGFFGGATLAAYSAASAFQDAVAEQHRGRSSVDCYSFAWSNWENIGQSRTLRVKELPRTRGFVPISAERGLQSLLIALAFRESSALIGLDGGNRHVRRYRGDAADVLEAVTVYYTEAGADAISRATLPPVRDRFGTPSTPPRVHVRELPKTATGAVDVEALAANRRALTTTARPRPSTATEQRVAEIWRQLLAVPDIGRDDNFFDVGGDSLLAAKLLGRIRDAFGVDLTMRAVFDSATLADLALQVEHASVQTATETQPAAGHSVSEGQRALWLLNQLTPESAAYNIAFTGRVRSPLQPDALRAAFQALVDRHAMLRSVFPAESGQPVRRPAKSRRVAFDVVDASSWPDDVIHERLRLDIDRPFDLANGPVLRVHLYTRSGVDAFLAVVVHHIAVDGWSLWSCLSELAELYSSAMNNAPPTLPPVGMDFDSYLNSQSDMLAGAESARHRDYWRQLFAGGIPVLNLPTDQPRAARRTGRGAAHRCRLDARLTQGLRALSRERRATLQMSLFALFHVLLHRQTGQEDLVVGYLSSGRSRPEHDSVVGYLANPLALPAHVSPDATVQMLLTSVRNTLLDALDHADYPFSLVVDHLAPQRDLSRTSLFDALFVFEKPQLFQDQPIASFIVGEPGAQMTLGELTIESLPFSAQREGQFDLTLVAVEAGDEVALSFDYDADLFTAATIGRLAERFERLARAAVNHPDMPIGTIDLLTQEEQDIVTRLNASSAPIPDVCFHHLFERHAADSADALAVLFDDQAVTYGELDRRAEALAEHLQDLGVTPDTPVGLYMERSPSVVAAILGILKAGGAFVPLDPSYPVDRLAYMVADTQLRVLVTTHALAPSVPPFNGKVVLIDELAAARDTARRSRPAVEPHHLAYVIYTSGTTGRPKGVLLEHRGLVNVAVEQQRLFGVGRHSRVLQFASLSFDASVFEMAMALGSGATLCMAPASALLPGPPLLETLRRMRVNVVTLPPSALLNVPVDPLPDLTTITVAGEACPREVVARWADGRRVFNLYGPTETTIWATFTQCTDPARTPTIGGPIANTSLFVLDRQRQRVPIGVPGELYIGGCGVARGYHSQEELTAERFVANPFGEGRLYRTGDLVRLLDSGELEYLGRIDSQVKIRGFRIELGEIETVLGQHPDVNEVAVIVREDSPGERRICAYVVLQDGVDSSTSTLKRFAAARLPDFMMPSAIVFVDALPLTPSGKIDRRALPLPGRQVEEAYVPPRTALEETLAAIWREMLKIDRVGTDDNFFDLGGTSLLIARVHARVNEMASAQLSMVEMFQHPTVRSLAARLSDDQTGSVADVAAPRGDIVAAGQTRLRDLARRRAHARAGNPVS